MPSGREYVRVYSEMASNPKWGRLSLLLRGAWVTLLVYAGDRNDPTFTVEQAIWLLGREGYKNGARLVNSLVDARWLDREGEKVTMHDWGKHQPSYRGPSDDPEYKRQRERERYQRNGSGTAWDNLGAPVTEERREEEIKKPPPNAHARDGTAAAYIKIYGRQPTESGVGWLSDLERDYGIDRTVAALVGEHQRDPDPKTIMSRMAAGLKNGGKNG